jgi:hypothetical protein
LHAEEILKAFGIAGSKVKVVRRRLLWVRVLELRRTMEDTARFVSYAWYYGGWGWVVSEEAEGYGETLHSIPSKARHGPQ